MDLGCKSQNICIVGKVPPIQGGVSTATFNLARNLALAGNQVHLVTNANDVEFGFRQALEEDDIAFMANLPGLHVHNLDRNALRHIPYSHAYLSRLCGKTLEVVERFGCSILLAWYFEPYCLAGAYVSKMTGLPLFVRHAGSDIGRLYENSNLRSAYRTIAANASKIITSSRPNIRRVVRDLGFSDGQICYSRAIRLPNYYFSPRRPMNIEAFHRTHTTNYLSSVGIQQETISKVINKKTVNNGRVMIGAYGKVGEFKGSYDLLSALNEVLNKGCEFNFIVCATGTTRRLQEYLNRLSEFPKLLLRTWLLPPMAPWKIPFLLDQLHVTAVLERKFPIAFHRPIIPREVIARGSCLLVSREIWEKQWYKNGFTNRKNALLVDDPEDVSGLAKTIEWLLVNREACRDIGIHGYFLSQTIEESLPSDDRFMDCIESSSVL